MRVCLCLSVAGDRGGGEGSLGPARKVSFLKEWKSRRLLEVICCEILSIPWVCQICRLRNYTISWWLSVLSKVCRICWAILYMCLGFQMSLTWTHKVIFGFLLCSLSHKLGLSLIFGSTGYCCNVGSSVWCGAILPAGGRPTFITKDMASLIS